MFCVCLYFAWPHFSCKVLTSHIMVSAFAEFFQNVTLWQVVWVCCYLIITAATEVPNPSVTGDSLLYHRTTSVADSFCCIWVTSYPYCQTLTLYSTVVIICATHVNMQNLYSFPHSVFVSYNSSNNQLVLVTVMHCVLCNVETEFVNSFVNVILLYRWTSILKGLNMNNSVFQY